MTDALDPSLEAALVAAAGRANVLVEESARRGAARDGLRVARAALGDLQGPVVPLAVVRPDDTAGVVRVVRALHGAGLPLVTLGGGTGLMGGARVVRPAIVLDLGRMSRVLAVNAADRVARVQAGTVFAALNSALAPQALFCGHDPWTVPIATVGGAISTNGLGYLAGRYGSIGDQVLGLTVVLPNGAVVETRATERTSTGPHLRRLWVGAEGTLGVITEVTLRVFPLPERRMLHALSFPHFRAGFAAVCALAALGLRPTTVDFGGPPRGGPALMYLAFDGLAEEVEALSTRALAICLEHGGSTRGEAVAQEFWEDRHVEPSRLQSWRRGEAEEPEPGTPGSVVVEYLHIYLPQSRVLEFLTRATAEFARAGADVSEWGLWHQPELISLVVRRTTDTRTELQALREAHDAALRLAQDLGGSMEYVHGVGLRLAHLIAREHGTGLSVLRAIKAVLDPEGLLNPGKLGF